MRWESRQNFCNDSTLTFLQQRCSLIYERSLHHYRWAFINNKIHVYFALKHMTSTPPFYFTNAPRSFLSWNIKNMFCNLYYKFIYIYSFTYCANKHLPSPPLMSYQWKLIKKNAWLSFGGMVLFIRKKKKKEINNYDDYAKRDKINQVFRLKTY